MRGVISEKLKPFLEQANTAIDEAKKNNVPFSVEVVRNNLEKLSAFIGEGPEIIHIEDNALEIENRKIPVRIYSPAPEQPLPVVLHFHGGGHMCGSVRLYDTISRKIAKAGHCIVIAVEYRLAPEYPYPAGIEDCQFALLQYKKLLKNVNYTEQLIILGDSAGGAICTTLSSHNINNANVSIDKQILIYPSVDYTMNSLSMEENGTGFLLEKDKISWYFENYFQSRTSQNNAQVDSLKNASPLYMPMDNTMPKTFILTGSCDPLKDEGVAYSKALKNIGVHVEHHHFDGMIHAFMLLDSLVASECEKAYQLIGEFVRS
jgi:acetyl esterase/lipase